MKSNSTFDVIFLGDTYFGEWHMRLRAKKGRPNVLRNYGYLYFAENFYPLLHEADLVLANLECAITDMPTTPLEGKKRHLYAADQVGTIDALKAANVSAVFLANNHSSDYGRQGLADTLSILSDNGIGYLGAGDNLEEAQSPFEYCIPIDHKEFRLVCISCYNHVKFSEEHGYYASPTDAGVNKLDPERIRKQVDDSKNQGECLLIVSPHWGPNFVWRTPAQRQMAKDLVSAGVDLIVGHSAHMLQEVEYIENKLVIYSIGNFILNGDGEYKQRNMPPYSLIARLSIRDLISRLDVGVKLYPIQCDNLQTGFQPRFVSEKEFNHVRRILRSHGFEPDQFDMNCSCGEDEYGLYFSLHCGTQET